MYENYCPIPEGATTRDVINSNNTETAIMLIKKYNLLNPNNQKPE
jgi:hypothetical protein